MCAFESYTLDYELLSFLKDNKEKWFSVRELYNHFEGKYSYKSILNNVKSLYKHGYVFVIIDGPRKTIFCKYKSNDKNNYFSFLKSIFENLKLKKKNL